MKANIVIFSLLVVLTFFFAINVAEASVIELTYDFATPVVEKELENYDVISMSLPKTSNAGLPVLPFKPVTVLIPYGEELEDIEVITGKKVLLGEGFIIEPGQAQIPSCFNGTITRTPPNTTVYDSSKEFPLEFYSSLPVQDLCGYKILFLNLYPVRYIPKPGEIWYYENMTVVVHTKEQGPKGGLDFYRGLPDDRARALELVDNHEETTSYDIQKPKKAGKGTSIVDPADSYDYVIITTEALKSSGGEYRFQDLVARKNQKGVATTTTLVPTNIMIYTKNHSNLHQQNNFRMLPLPVSEGNKIDSTKGGIKREDEQKRYFRPDGHVSSSSVHSSISACAAGTYCECDDCQRRNNNIRHRSQLESIPKHRGYT